MHLIMLLKQLSLLQGDVTWCYMVLHGVTTVVQLQQTAGGVKYGAAQL